MKISDNGLKKIGNEEGFVDHVYLCPAGVRTWGYGHAKKSGEVEPAHITQEDALELLRRDASLAEAVVNKVVHATVSQNQFDAMVSLCFNIGGGAFAGSTLVRKLNQGDEAGAAEEFLAWCRATKNGIRVTLPLLQKRRQRERELFLTADG